jgi:hypothetical protein
MFAGLKITLGEGEYIIPPISLGQLRSGLLAQLQQHDALVNEGKVFEAMSIRAEVILAALRRNYPDFPEQQLLDNIDLGTCGPIWMSILGASGFTPGEVVAATATTAASKGNGTLSLSTEA